MADSSKASGATPNNSPLQCRDFSTAKDMNLPMCDFITIDQLKTNLLSLIITEQKSSSDPKVKEHLVSIERYSIQKISEICHLKGRLILQTPGLISGCIYNQFIKIKMALATLKTNSAQVQGVLFKTPSEEQAKFDIFINDLLFDLAEKNRNYYPNNATIKALMAEVLKIYGGDGKSLYASFLGICGLESLSSQNPSNNTESYVLQCEEDYLKDLRQTLFLAI